MSRVKCVGGSPPVVDACLAVSSCWRLPPFNVSVYIVCYFPMRCRFCTSVLESDAGQWGLGHSLFSVGHSVPPVFGACTSVAAAIYNIMIGEFRSYGARPSFQSAHGSLHHIGGSPRVQHDYIYIYIYIYRAFSTCRRFPACLAWLFGGFPPVICISASLFRHVSAASRLL
jgi:hypothetical protein